MKKKLLILFILFPIISIAEEAPLTSFKFKSIEYIKSNITPYQGKTLDLSNYRLKGDDVNSVILEAITDKVKNLENCEFAIPLSYDQKNNIFTAKDYKGYILCPDVKNYLELKVSINDSQNQRLNGINEKTKKSVLISLK